MLTPRVSDLGFDSPGGPTIPTRICNHPFECREPTVLLHCSRLEAPFLRLPRPDDADGARHRIGDDGERLAFIPTDPRTVGPRAHQQHAHGGALMRDYERYHLPE